MTDIDMCIYVYWLIIYNVCDALLDLVPFVQFKNMKSTQGGVLLLVKLSVFHVF